MKSLCVCDKITGNPGSGTVGCQNQVGYLQCKAYLSVQTARPISKLRFNTTQTSPESEVWLNLRKWANMSFL